MVSSPPPVVVCASRAAVETDTAAAATISTLEGTDGIDVLTATDSGSVLATLAEQQVACVVATDSLPEDGLSVLETIREARPGVPVVLAAPDGSERLATAALRGGATDYVPASGDAVAERVTALLADERESGSGSGGGTGNGSGTGNGAETGNGTGSESESGSEQGPAAERSPRQRRKLLAALEETFPDSVYIYGADGTYLDALLGWRRKQLTAREDLLGRQVGDVLPDPAATRIQEAIERTLASGDLQTVEYALGTGSETHWFEGLLTPIPDYSDRPAVLLAAHDVTERKRYEQRLEAQHRRLERLADVVSHDLKTPLSTAQSVVRLLRADIDDPEPEVEQSIEDMETILGRIEQFAGHLPKLARESTEVRQPVDCELAAVAEAAWELVETGDLTLDVVDSRTLPADPDRLRQAFQNLFRNTVDHASTGTDGDAPVATDRMTGRTDDPTQSATTVRVGTMPDGFYVADDGPGIGPDQGEEIFDYGMSTGEGSGMGLAIVRTIVEAHGWEITVSDGRDGGARFEVTTGRGLDAEPEA